MEPLFPSTNEPLASLPQLHPPLHALDLTHNDLKPSSSLPSSECNHKFTVAVRIKPKESQEHNTKVIVSKNRRQIFVSSAKAAYSSHGHTKHKTFKVDTIFTEESSNQDIFEQAIRDKLTLLQKGTSVSLMAYGATNSGKSYSIFGPNEQPSQGLVFVSGQYLINQVFHGNYKFYLSYLEVYNENVRDLLSESSKSSLSIFQDERGKVNIPNLTRVEVTDYQNYYQLIQKGNHVRAQASNNVNSRSSRSHAVVQLEIFSEGSWGGGSFLKPLDVTFMVVDLAGSEKSTPYYQAGQQAILKQGSNINRSLLALGNCITNLSNGHPHIPYRDSKLTRILKQHLSGDSHSIMVACISQETSQYEETIKTLQYASKACKIEAVIKDLEGKNRWKHMSVPCQHCGMSLSYAFFQKSLKNYSLKIVDSLQKMSHVPTTITDTLLDKMSRQQLGLLERDIKQRLYQSSTSPIQPDIQPTSYTDASNSSQALVPKVSKQLTVKSGSMKSRKALKVKNQRSDKAKMVQDVADKMLERGKSESSLSQRLKRAKVRGVCQQERQDQKIDKTVRWEQSNPISLVVSSIRERNEDSLNPNTSDLPHIAHLNQQGLADCSSLMLNSKEVSAVLADNNLPEVKSKKICLSLKRSSHEALRSRAEGKENSMKTFNLNHQAKTERPREAALSINKLTYRMKPDLTSPKEQSLKTIFSARVAPTLPEEEEQSRLKFTSRLR